MFKSAFQKSNQISNQIKGSKIMSNQIMLVFGQIIKSNSLNTPSEGGTCHGGGGGGPGEGGSGPGPHLLTRHLTTQCTGSTCQLNLPVHMLLVYSIVAVFSLLFILPKFNFD